MGVAKIIYKYRDCSCENHRRMLTHNEIFLASPGSFNDPFDCKISTHYLSLDSAEKIDQYLQKKREESDTELSDNFIDKLRHRLENITEYWEMFEALEFTAVDQNYGVLSLSERWDSILMWSHYGSQHQGFCIGFNEQKMRDSGHFSFGGSVIYSDDFPIIDPLFNDDRTAFLQLQYKATDWEYEKEYRLTKIFFPEAPNSNTRKIILDSGCIEEVTIGMHCNREHSDEIINFCKQKNIKVYGASRIPYKFGLVRFEL